MNWSRISFLAGAALLSVTESAHACDFPFFGTFLSVPKTQLEFGGFLGFTTSDPSVTVVSGDVGFKLGTKGVARPAIGICHAGGGGDGDSSNDLMFGGGVGFNVWNNVPETFALNVQSGLSFISSDGATDITIPIVLAGQFKANDKTMVHGGVGMSYNRFSYDAGTTEFSGSASSTDPVISGGVTFNEPKASFTAGLQILVGDSKTFTSLLAGVRVPLGK